MQDEVLIAETSPFSQAPRYLEMREGGKIGEEEGLIFGCEGSDGTIELNDSHSIGREWGQESTHDEFMVFGEFSLSMWECEADGSSILIPCNSPISDVGDTSGGLETSVDFEITKLFNFLLFNCEWIMSRQELVEVNKGIGEHSLPERERERWCLSTIEDPLSWGVEIVAIVATELHGEFDLRVDELIEVLFPWWREESFVRSLSPWTMFIIVFTESLTQGDNPILCNNIGLWRNGSGLR
jgi:hypothetical protein